MKTGWPDFVQSRRPAPDVRNKPRPFRTQVRKHTKDDISLSCSAFCEKLVTLAVATSFPNQTLAFEMLTS